MLRSLQIEINQRTEELAELSRRDQKLSPAQQSELKSLAEEQGTLAELVRDLLSTGNDEERGTP